MKRRHSSVHPPTTQVQTTNASKNGVVLKQVQASRLVQDHLSREDRMAHQLKDDLEFYEEEEQTITEDDDEDEDEDEDYEDCEKSPTPTRDEDDLESQVTKEEKYALGNVEISSSSNEDKFYFAKNYSELNTRSESEDEDDGELVHEPPSSSPSPSTETIEGFEDLDGSENVSPLMNGMYSSKTMGSEVVPGNIQPGTLGKDQRQPIAGIRYRRRGELFDRGHGSEREWLRDMLANHFLFRGYPLSVIDGIVSSMMRLEHNKGDVILEEGSIGDCMYVCERGRLAVSEVSCDRVVDELVGGRVFGELGMLYSSRRAASVVVAEDGTVLWRLCKGDMDPGLLEGMSERLMKRMKFLLGNPEFNNLGMSDLRRVSAVMQEEVFREGDAICREGESLVPGVNDKFYSIGRGSVRVCVNVDGVEKELAVLEEGQWFGEMSLLHDRPRSASVYANEDNTLCYTLSRSAFFQVVSGNSGAIRGIASRSELRDLNTTEAVLRHVRNRGAQDIVGLESLRRGVVIGEGGFSVVRLVEHVPTRKTYALKIMNKHDICVRNQQEHVNNERKILHQSSHPFILSLIKTFQDEDRLYMLLELVQGGELFSRVIQSAGGLPLDHVRFYSACVCDGLSYLHHKRIVYRDLKLENLVVARDGYLKIIDFGFAKQLRPGETTNTLCGTPDYLAPEAVTRRGHSFPIDAWALGVLIYEMLTQCSPYADASGNNNQMVVFERIMQGHPYVDWAQLLRVFTGNMRNQFTLTKNMLEQLWNPSPRQRITLHELKQHPFFLPTVPAFSSLREKTIQPPWVPSLHGPSDTRYFDVEAFRDVRESTNRFQQSKIFEDW